MPLLRRLALLAAVAAGFAVVSGSALAAYPRNNGLPFQVDAINFRVHYQSDKTTAYAITQTQAGDIAALADRALAAEMADGYPRPLSDGALGGDGRIDIYVEDLTSSPGVAGFAKWDANNPTSSGFIELAGNIGDPAFSQHVIAHELFHLVQFSMWRVTALSDYWLLEASAEWMGFRVNGYPVPDNEIVPLDLALDCRDPIGTSGGGDSNKCDLTDDYLGNGYSRWPFFEYLIENYGTGYLKNIFAKGLAGSPSAIQAVSDALVASGTTLADTYNNWIAAAVRGGYAPATLQARPVEVYGAPISTGTVTKALPQQKVAVNHLSTRILQFDRGGGSASGTCYNATLSLSVTIPAGTLSKPLFYWNMPGTPITPLSVNGNKATATVPWDTCSWPTGHGYLVLPNGSSPANTVVDAADFVVDSSIAVTTVPTAGADPPPAVVVTGPVVQAPTGELAPTLSIFGPQLLTFSASVKQIRLIVESNGAGSVQATLGTLALGTQAVRVGNNDVRFTLPAGVLQSLRRSSASAANVLTLTPLSPGGAAGQAQTREVRVEPVAVAKPPAAKKPAAKAKPKPKPKPKKTSRK
jgi:hypothetical protein